MERARSSWIGGALVGAVLCVVATTVVLAGTAGASPAIAQQLFRNCDEARAAGFSAMRAGEPGYSADLDADGDGVACDESQVTPAVPAVPEPAPQPPPQPAMPEVQGATQDALASTGVSLLTPFLLVAALLLVVMGRRLVDVGHEHLRWVPGRRRSEVRYTVERDRRRRR